MATPVKKRIISLAKKGKKPSEIHEILSKEGIKTKNGTIPSPAYIGVIARSESTPTRVRRKKNLPTLVNVPIDSPDNVCIVFGSSEKVERALGMLRDIYQSGR